MTSRLSSLLVRDGLINVSRMEHVFQRQVLYGGSLDTILLEMELIEDHRLQHYLSLSSGLPTSKAAKVEVDDAVRKICTRDIASRYQIVPTRLNHDSIEVMVCYPVDTAALDGLTEELQIRVLPSIVPEYRFRIGFATLYGEQTDKRFATLAEKANNTVTHEYGAVRPPNDSTRRLTPNGKNGAGAIDLIEVSTAKSIDTTCERARGKRSPVEQPERRQTNDPTSDTTPSAPRTGTPQRMVSPEQRNALSPQRVSTLPAEENRAASHLTPITQELSTEGTLSTVTTITDSIPHNSEAQSSHENSLEALVPADARQRLQNSEDRDDIFVTLLRAFRKHFQYSALFIVQGQNATGRVALNNDGLDRHEIKKISVPLQIPSRFQQVALSGALSWGPLDLPQPPMVQNAIAAMGGGELPTMMLLLPIVLRDRVIAIAVGHSGPNDVPMRRFTEVLPLAADTANAVLRLLAAKRSGASPNDAPVTSVKKTNACDAQKLTTQERPPANPIPVPDPEMIDLFAQIQGDNPELVEVAIQQALNNVDKAIAHLDFCFPGKLTKLRNSDDPHLPQYQHEAADYGPVLDLVVRIGPRCGCALSEKMRDADREVRYYATLCAAAIRPNDVVDKFVERLFDGDAAIRSLAVNALASYPSDIRHPALEFARRALHSEDNERLKLAAQGLTKLGDVSSISDIIDAHSRGGDAAEVSQHALFLLTNQEYGSNNAQWREWWNHNKSGNRIEWMLGGLASKNSAARKNAAETLRELTGQFFGYGYDLPKKQRDKARKKWLNWWEQANRP